MLPATPAGSPRVGVDDVVIPVGGECDGSWLSDARIPHVQAVDVASAVATASADFERGAVGAGAGMSCFGWKGGIGTASRRADAYVVGVVLLTNFGAPEQLRVNGVSTGPVPPDHRKKAAGSCIGAVATDAPLAPQDLERPP